ncbi:ArnT family glycosyltransferase [Chthonobacter albigriseus]|uniref:ArnT family glycosyltransferase n=1 Tax=Chthonobacter albigriseus TaxID=1683161 RepID=UPI0015EF0DFB|nr:glycosyltransferase family 39 protein [Chthonobacter albigriseus]
MSTLQSETAPEASAAPAPASAPTAPRRPSATRIARIVIDLAVLAVVALLVLAPGLDRLPLTDRDEARFVQATRQMVETGDWLDIRLQEEPRYKKPIGIYWLQGLAVTASGQGADAPLTVYRIPSLVAAVVAVLLAYGIGVVLGGPTVGLVGALLFSATILLGVEARLAKTDAVLLATVLAAQLALASAWMDGARARKLWRSLVFFGAVGLGVLVKGPVILLVCGTTLALLMILERSVSVLLALRPLVGLPVMLALVLPWFVAIGIVSEGAFFREAIGTDFLGKIAAGQESHGAPPGMYLLVSIVTFWPAVAFIPAGIAWLIGARATPAGRFLIAWALPSWVLFELAPTKLPHYVLPLLPALAIAAGFAVSVGAVAARGWWRRASFAWLAVAGVLLAVALPGAFVFYEGRADPVGLAGAVIAGAASIVAWRLAASGRIKLAIPATVIAGGLMAALAHVIVLPAAGSIWLSDRAAEALARLPTCADPVRISIGYGEPSLVFRIGTDLRLLSPEEGAAVFAASPCAVAIVDSRVEGAFLVAAAANAVRPVPAADVTGRNLNGMRERTLRFYIHDAAAP